MANNCRILKAKFIAEMKNIAIIILKKLGNIAIIIVDFEIIAKSI